MNLGPVVGGALLGALVACTTGSAFSCTDDAQCGDGTCQIDVGYCSFIDDTCPSGERYGEFAGGGLADECVMPAGTTGAETTTTTTTTVSTITVSTTGAEATGEPDSTTTGGMSLPCPDDWWDCDWSTRMALDAVWTGPTLPGFAVRVSLSPGRIDPDAFVHDGADFRFVGDDGLLVPHEVEWLSSGSGRAELWVRLPQLEDGARVWLYWGNDAASDDQDPAAVWAAEYEAVWHLGPDLRDSTEVHHLEDTGSLDFEGRIGRARLFDGTSLLRPVTQESFLTLFAQGGTISAWVLPIGWGQNDFGRVLDNARSNQANGGFYFSLNGTPEALRFSMEYTSNSPVWETEPATIELDRWQHVAVTYEPDKSGDFARLYIDGVQMPLANDPSPTEEPVLDSTETATIGALGNGEIRFFDGMIDEVRLSSTPRDADWIAAETMSAEDLLLEYGRAELRPE